MSQPIDTTVTLEDQFAVVDPISSAPPGSDIEAYVEEGVVQLPLGGQVVTVTFLTPKVSPDYQFDVRDIYNMVDATPLVIDCILTNFTVTGFEITLSASPDTGNYYFRWKVRIPTAIQSGITITAQVAGVAGGSVQKVFATGNDGLTGSVGGDPTKLPNVTFSLADGGIPLVKLAETVVTGPVLTPTGAQTVTNKLFDGNNNTFQNIGLASLTGDGIIAQNLTDPLSDEMIIWDNGADQFRFMGTPIVRGMAKDVYLSARSDGKNGTGTAEDPWDASTAAKFDAILADNTKTPVNTRIHLVGTGFQTNPITRTWHFRDGWDIGGSGIDVTTITNVAVGDGSTFYSVVTLGDDAGTHTSNGVHIHDLTIDSNGTAIAATMATVNAEKNVKVEHIWICGSNNTVERVHGVHQYGSLANGVECFGFILSVPTGGGKNNHIRYCINDSPVGNYGSPFTMFGFSGTYPIANSSVERCYAEASNTGLITPFNSGGVNLAFVQNCEIKGNVFVDCRGVSYCDTGTIDGLKIDGNTAVRGWSGVEFSISAGTPRRVEVTDNTLFIQNRVVASRAYGVLFGAVQASATDIAISGNKQYYANDGGGFDEFSSIRVVNAVNASAINNKTDPTSFADTALTGAGLFVTANRQHDGSVLVELPDASAGDRLWVGGGTPSGYGTGDVVARRSATTGQYYFGDYSGNRSIYHDGTAFNVYTGNWLPGTDDTISLGSAPQRWSYLYLAHTATISGLVANRLVATEGSKTLTSVTPQSTTGTTTGFTAASGTAVLAGSTFTGGSGTAYTIGDVVLALKTIGALAP
jgi:hypothetical protein